MKDSCQGMESSESLGLQERVTLNANGLARLIRVTSLDVCWSLPELRTKLVVNRGKNQGGDFIKTLCRVFIKQCCNNSCEIGLWLVKKTCY